MLFSPRAMAICAMLAAMSIVCGKYLAIPLGNVMRFSFENLDINNVYYEWKFHTARGAFHR